MFTIPDVTDDTHVRKFKLNRSKFHTIAGRHIHQGNTRESTINDIWSLDAHCDTWYMREFLKETKIPPELAGLDPDTFFQVTPSRLKEGNVRCLFVNAGDIGLLTSSAIIDNLHRWAEKKEIWSLSARMLLMCPGQSDQENSLLY